MANLTLPEFGTNQSYFDVSALEGGSVTLRDDLFIDDAIDGKVSKLPALSFLLTHSSSGKRVVFDLGIRHDWRNLPPSTVQEIDTFLNGNLDMGNGDVVDSLAKGGLKPEDITYVLPSHLHWDHIGDPGLFSSPSTTFITGAQSRTLFDPGYPKDPDSRYHSDLLPDGRTVYFDTSEWPSVGPFPHGLNFFNDGSLYLIDADGHLPGHLNALVRTSSDGGWVYLAGDSAHLRSLLTGTSGVKVGTPWDPNYCIHTNKEAAEEHIRRIKVLMETEPRVRVVLAHDTEFYENYNPSGFLPNKLESL